MSRKLASSDVSLIVPPTVSPGAVHDVTAPSDVHHAAREKPRRAPVSASAPPLPLQEVVSAASMHTGPTANKMPTDGADTDVSSSTNRTTESGSANRRQVDVHTPSHTSSSASSHRGDDEAHKGDDDTGVARAMASVLARISALEAEKQTLLADLAVLDGPLQVEQAGLEQEHDDLATAQTALQDSISAAVRARQEAQKHVHELQEAIAQREEIVHKAVRHTSRLHDELSRMERDRDAAKAERAATARAHRESLRKQDALTLAVEDLQNQRAHLIAEAQRREAALAASQASLRSTREQLAALRSGAHGLTHAEVDSSAARGEDAAEEQASSIASVGEAAVRAAPLADEQTSDQDAQKATSELVYARREQLATLQDLYARVQAVLSRDAQSTTHGISGSTCAALEPTRRCLMDGATLCDEAAGLVTELEKLVPI